MRSYLEHFFHTYQYPREDAELLLSAYDRIASDAAAKELWDRAMRLYEERIDCDYEEIIALCDRVAGLLYLHEYTLELLIFICLSRQTEKEYRKHGIENQIFHDTMLDLRYKMEECKMVKGIVGTFVWDWFKGFFDLTRFALGRLQFEIIKFDDEFQKNGKVLTPDCNVINVHIPRTATPLDPQSCDRAFRMARDFFGTRLGCPCAFVCYSWLLYPEHEEMLSKESNVYRFMRRFDLLKWKVDKGRGDLWRLFDTDEKDPDKLPTDTSMRRAYVRHLKNGGKVGSARGVFFFEE